MKDRSSDPYADFEEELAFEVRRPPIGRPAARRPPAVRSAARRPPGRKPPRPRPFRRLPWWSRRGGSLTLGLLDREPPPEPAAEPAQPSAPAAGARTESRPCPQAAGTATDRCSSPQPCPAVPDLRCVTRVAGIPFHYVADVGRPDPATGLRAVTRRQEGRVQRMVPRAIASLEAFVRNARSFGLPFDVILTLGSLYCRCSRVKGQPSTALSNHSYGDAIDVAGVRWASGGPASRVRETIVHNFQDREQRALLRRLNACLRLSFATVIDYHRPDHRDHFHCDTNQGRGRITRGATTLRFVQEALGVVLQRTVPTTGKLDEATRRALLDFSQRGPEIFQNDRLLNQVFDRLFRRMAAG